ncbi:Vacuolar protein sorting-associated protein 37A [Gamsiella multidivaricata]|nr:Vacuolar protein sorting-associated protein 37A [Gamsiella multidivaricata]
MNSNHHSPGHNDSTSSARPSTATLTIYLPPGFPEDEPRLTIQPTVRHLWVNGATTPCTVTGHERLMPGGWSTHANLGRIVKEIVANIQRTGVLVGGGSSDDVTTMNNHNTHNGGNTNANPAYEEYSHKPPPPIPGIRSKSLGQFGNHSSTSYSNVNGSHYHHTGQGGASSSGGYMSSSSSGEDTSGHHAQARSNNVTNSGVYGTTLSPEARLVMELSAEQIDELLESPIAFEHFFDQLEVVVNSRTLKREWWHGNDNVARRTLMLESEMAELQKSTAEGHEIAKQLQKTLEERLQQQQDALWRFKPETLQSKLRAAAAESDELSESVSESFWEGKLDQESFIRQYRDLKKVYHLRMMKNERIESILRSHPSSTGTGSGQDGPGSTANPGSAAGAGSSVGMRGDGGGIGAGSGTGSGGAGGSSGSAGAASDPWVML